MSIYRFGMTVGKVITVFAMYWGLFAPICAMMVYDKGGETVAYVRITVHLFTLIQCNTDYDVKRTSWN